MSTRNLDKYFSPGSIALIGASRRDHAVGAVVTKNLLTAGFKGPILPVNPHETAIGSVLAYPDIESLPVAPDLAVLATPAATVPDMVARLGRKGCRAAVVITAGFEAGDKAGQAERDQLIAAGRANDIRIIGPNCLGILAPSAGVNASFAHAAPPSGRIACVMQSGALAAAVLDWAVTRNIGLSKMVSIGDAIDVDFGDMLNYLAADPETDAILLYVEGLTHARKFMEAAQGAARRKPIIALKAGRSAETAHVAKSHSGAIAGSDRVYQAAFRRAGMVRVDTLDELLAAAELLARMRPPHGERLAIVTNGGGAGLLASDGVFARGGALATLEPQTIAALDKKLPPMWSHGNPIDIIGDADGDRYEAALKAAETDPTVDAVLTIHCPTAVASPADAARGVIAAMSGGRETKPTLACWIGDSAGREARVALVAAGIPTFTQPESAVAAFMHLVEARHQRERVIDAADAATPTIAVDRATVNRLLCSALERGQEWLDEVDAKAVLTAYGIPVASSVKAADPDEVAEAAAGFGGPVAVKIRSPDLTHKTDLGGVALDLTTPEAARKAAEAMLSTVREKAPKARLDGFVVEKMVTRPGSFELIAGLSSDATFGPVVVFGHGGVDVSQIADTAIALPPLTRLGAAELVGATHVARQLRGGRGRSPVDLAAVEEVLVRLARLALDHPEIAELDINPLLADATGAIALDARIRARDPSFAVLPACHFPPHQGERHIAGSDGADILIRALRPEDAPALQHFVETLDPATIRGRFFEMIKRLPPALLDRLTQIDYDREAAFIAIDRTANPDDDVICGVGRLIVLPGDKKAEYALTASPEMMDRGIGRALMDDLILFGKRRGLEELCGTELIESTALIDLAHQSGGVITQDMEDPSVACIALKLVPFAKAA